MEKEKTLDNAAGKAVKTMTPVPKDDMPSGIRRGKNVFVFTMLIFPLIGFVLFYVVINFQSILLAFQQVTGFDDYGREITSWTFVQFSNAIKMFTGESEELSLALKNTMLYWIAANLVMTPVTFVFSYFFNRKLLFGKFFRVAIYLPNIISAVALCTAYKCIVAPNGPISEFMFTVFDYDMPNLLRTEETATGTILFFQIFMGLNVNLLLFQGAFNRIPEEVIEAGKLDGTTAFVELTRIMIPMMWPTLSTLLILHCSGIFGASGQILLFTGGDYGTTTISYWVYQQVKLENSYNLPSAMGLILTAINLPIVMIVRKLCSLVDDVVY